MGTESFVKWLFIYAVLLGIYFVPSVVATVRKHPSSAAIFAVNLIFGLSFIGWVAALIWSLTGARGGTTVINGDEYMLVRKR